MASALDPVALLKAAGIFLAFIAFLFVGALVFPGKNELGVALPDGTRQKYKLNGFSSFLIVTALTALGCYTALFSLASLHHLFWPLLVVVNLFAFSFTLYLVLTGRRKLGGRPGVGGFISDSFYGVEINPNLFGVDLKMFSYRPSLIGLGLLNVSFAFAQYEAHGLITTRMWLFQIFYFIYLTNYFQFEYGMLYTWDIIAEKFGWMLVWGDYALVPFFYSVPGWFLIDNLDPMPSWEPPVLCALFALGFWIFRGTNEQKHRYKVNPQTHIWGKPAQAVGGRLLVSGFWGIGRKLNYTGELCIYFSWTLTTGFHSIVPYLLPLWLFCLFTHRAWRDDQRCRAKYGPLWVEYCAHAKFKMFPFIY